ncbi:hypothetical protein GCM10022259_29690 [Aquimarina mytili]
MRKENIKNSSATRKVICNRKLNQINEANITSEALNNRCPCYSNSCSNGHVAQ